MRILLLAAFSALGLAACASTPPTPKREMPQMPNTSTAAMAVANLAAASGSLVSGKLTLMPMGNGVHVSGDIGGLTPGSSHGFHIHETGDCSAADASSAGGHFNPAGSMHGKAEAGAHHAGDIDNIVADGSGVAHVNAHVMGVSLGGSGANDIAGRAFVVHAAPDDYATQPAGNSGARIACGMISVTR
ncbi:MAG TPA: superoxide dismutase family protein [Luteimonas sp.]|nr:superoxide dismutase family protein [Luteimonas sp.]